TSDPTLRDLKVLIVDDNASTRQSLGDVIASWGMTPIIAEGAAAAAEAAANDGIDVALIDAHMPGPSGADLASRLLSTSQRLGPVILMLNADDRGVAPRDSDGVPIVPLTKPINHSELFDTIVALIDG